jgi:hypothetical protein
MWQQSNCVNNSCVKAKYSSSVLEYDAVSLCVTPDVSKAPIVFISSVKLGQFSRHA